ncbi:MAG: sugar phosphate nucleotidyltransferase [Patescibacteria group bacterium]|jgi:NDP-sugar pyrophosphorylase family protein
MPDSRRQRITITIREDLLPLVDGLVDGRKIRNRSHAIESVLDKELSSRVKSALVLAGGEGVKMRPFTYEMPKTMIPLNGKPILEYVVLQLQENGFKNISIVIGKLGEQIEKHFGNGEKFGVQINYIKEKEPKGTGAAIRLAKGQFEGTFLVMYGDVLINMNLREFVNFHLKHSAVASAAVTTTDDPTEYGALRLHGSYIVEYKEKPKKGKGLSHMVSAGVYVMEPAIFAEMDAHTRSLERDIFPKLVQEKTLLGYPFDGAWFDISTPENYERAREEWK